MKIYEYLIVLEVMLAETHFLHWHDSRFHLSLICALLSVFLYIIFSDALSLNEWWSIWGINKNTFFIFYMCHTGRSLRVKNFILMGKPYGIRSLLLKAIQVEEYFNIVCPFLNCGNVFDNCCNKSVFVN